MPGDPWQHRSRSLSCETCMWYAPKAAADGTATTLGRCRRHAPTMAGYPAVFESDWCGDHKLDEEKLAPVRLSGPEEPMRFGAGTPLRPGGLV